MEYLVGFARGSWRTDTALVYHQDNDVRVEFCDREFVLANMYLKHIYVFFYVFDADDTCGCILNFQRFTISRSLLDVSRRHNVTSPNGLSRTKAQLEIECDFNTQRILFCVDILFF